MKKLLLLLLFSPSLYAQSLVDCAPGTPCTLTGPSLTKDGDQPWYAFGKVNNNFLSLWPLLLNTYVQNITSTGLSIAVTQTGSTTNVDVQSVDVSKLSQTSTSDTINVGLLPPPTVVYSAASLAISSVHNNSVVVQSSSSATTVTLNVAGVGGLAVGQWTIIDSAGTGSSTLSAGGGATINGASSSIILTQYMSALAVLDVTGTNWSVTLSGGFLPNGVGAPVYATSLIANYFVPTSTTCGINGASGRLALFGTSGVQFCTYGNSTLTVDNNGNVNLSNGGTFTGALSINTSGVLIASLPSCAAGTKGTFMYVTNGVASPSFLGTVSSTGSTIAPVFCNGTNWVYH